MLWTLKVTRHHCQTVWQYKYHKANTEAYCRVSERTHSRSCNGHYVIKPSFLGLRQDPMLTSILALLRQNPFFCSCVAADRILLSVARSTRYFAGPIVLED